MNKLFLDIETIPAPDKYREYFKEKYDKQFVQKEDFETFFRRSAIDGNFGRILCIGYAKDNERIDIIYSKREKEILEKFWDIAKNVDLFIGHNVMDFDLRYIYKRSIINAVRPSQILSFARYRSSPIYDTMREWEYWANSSISLDTLSKILNLKTSKLGLSGDKVYDTFKAGKIKKILEYCKQDVRLTREIYNRMKFLDKRTLL